MNLEDALGQAKYTELYDAIHHVILLAADAGEPIDTDLAREMADHVLRGLDDEG